VYVADLPRLSDGQLSQIEREAREVLDSLNRRLDELHNQLSLTPADQDTRIRATTKRDVTERFLASIAQEQELRRSNPALRSAAGESLARAFLELARHRLPGSTFDSLLQEALAACSPSDPEGLAPTSQDPQVLRLLQGGDNRMPRPEALPVVLTPDPPRASGS
jgi:anti-sigma factor RsiW